MKLVLITFILLLLCLTDINLKLCTSKIKTNVNFS